MSARDTLLLCKSPSGRGLLRDVGARCFHIDGIQGFACGHEQPVAPATAETDVGAGFGQTDHSDAIAVRRNDLNSRTGSSPDVAVHVTTNAICRGWLRSPRNIELDESLSIADRFRSEERRVGKECRSRWSPDH